MKTNRSRRIMLIMLAAALVGLASFAVWQVVTARTGASSTHAGVISAEKTQIVEGLQQDLQSANVPEAQDNLQAKLDALDSEATRQAEAIAKGAVKPQDVCKVFPEQTEAGQPPAASGIVERDVLIPGEEDVRVNNLWSGVYGGQTWVLYAGSTDSGAGVLVLSTGDGSFSQRFDLPEGSGAARIIAEKALRLEISIANSNTPFYLDLPARALTSDAAASLPTLPLLPTATLPASLCD